MNKYTLKFFIWDKALSIELFADSEIKAVELLKKIIWDRTRIIQISEEKDPVVEKLKDIFKIK